jgi:5-methylcytosine-specific restriction protein A
MATMKFCVHCGRHYEIGTGVRNRCGDCGRAYDRELSKRKRARRARSSMAWQKARKAARLRDGERCRRCGSVDSLEVHHVVPLAQGGAEFALSNLITLCRECHAQEGAGANTDSRPSHPATSFSRNKFRGGERRSEPLIG